MLVGRCVCESARLMVGVPNYDAYVAHMTKTHPGQPPMSYEAFFRERQDARYGGGGKGGFRCC
ncbi:YbdD/YjiX family protein [Caulobacter segnis]|uniref:YbdD/YjiX family protein n=1 Tax=Caulobacter segnis TaxID=88688 RepID=UPI00286BFA63|nr:YbdD/YjiX family protein [Caulobacter segnis]